MIISFIKVGLIIGLSSIGGLIYQTLKNAQGCEIEVEEVIKDKHLKLLIDHKNKIVDEIDSAQSINSYWLEEKSNINEKY